MSDQTNSAGTSPNEKSEMVDRCLSLVLHHEEMQVLAGVIKDMIEESSPADETEGGK